MILRNFTVVFQFFMKSLLKYFLKLSTENKLPKVHKLHSSYGILLIYIVKDNRMLNNFLTFLISHWN